MGIVGMMPQTGQKVGAGEFFRQVRQEANKVTWPTRKETLVTTAMVFAMSFLAAIFFFVVDWLVSHGVRLILGLGA
jgi:preprotein translocase subunit SecE